MTGQDWKCNGEANGIAKQWTGVERHGFDRSGAARIAMERPMGEAWNDSQRKGRQSNGIG